MKRKLLTSAGLLAVATLALAFDPNPAQAGLLLQINLQSGGNSYTSNPTADSLTVSQAIGSFTTTINTGTATDTPTLDLSSAEINSSGGGTLVVTLSANGFTTPNSAANWLSQFSGNFVSGSANVTLQTFLDNSDTLLGEATALSTLTDAATPFGISDVTDATADGSFALTEVLTITTTGAAHVSLDGSIAYVPEPASLTLLGAGMIGVGALARRRRAGSAAAAI